MRSPVSWRAVAPLAVLTLLLAGCSAGAGPATPDASGPAPAAPVTITNCGTPVTVTTPPARVVTLNQAATEIMLALGLQDRMIGTAYLDDEILPEYAAAYARIPVLAEEYPAKEKVLEAEPDFVYASYHSAFGAEGVGDRAGWQKLGVGSYLSPAGCAKPRQPAKLRIDDVFGEIREIAAIFGVPDRGERLVAEHQGLIATATVTETPGERAAEVMWWDGGSDAPSVGACCGAPGMIMEEAGVTNVFADVTGGWGDTAWETVAERNPQVIVLVDASWDPAEQKKAFLARHSTLRNLPAVREQRYVVIPFSATTPGVRNVLAIETLAGSVPTLPLGAPS